MRSTAGADVIENLTSLLPTLENVNASLVVSLDCSCIGDSGFCNLAAVYIWHECDLHLFIFIDFSVPSGIMYLKCLAVNRVRKRVCGCSPG